MTAAQDPGERRRGVPAATYRLQVHAGFGLDDAAGVADYLADLGVTHAYSSPLLRSAEGSTHGYDTVDHAHIDEARGGREARGSAASRWAAAHGPPEMRVRRYVGGGWDGTQAPQAGGDRGQAAPG